MPRQKKRDAVRRLCVLMVLEAFLGASPCLAQRHLPALQIFESVESVRLDVVVESPAVDNGAEVADVPRPGENVSFQVFLPRAAGLIVFEHAIELDNADSLLTRAFRIVSVNDWLERDLKSLASKNKPTFYRLRLMPAPLPSTGHTSTIVLSPLGPLQNLPPLKVTCFVTAISDPPRRVWQMRGTRELVWR